MTRPLSEINVESLRGNPSVLHGTPSYFDFAEFSSHEDNPRWEVAFDTSRRECPHCDEGEVECEACGSYGEIECDKCDGVGNIICPWCDGLNSDCPHCDETGDVSCPHCDGKGEFECETCDGTGQCACQHCEAGMMGDEHEDDWLPMMNYIYPLPDHFEVPEDIRDRLCCCTVVEINDQHYLALTGGGMDLSWEIVETYIRLGLLPPVHFCELPAMTGRGTNENDRTIIDACVRSYKTIEEQMVWRRVALQERFPIQEETNAS